MIRCIAIDDEPIALSIVRQYCERRGGIELETYSSPRAGMARVKEWRPDVVFLDIEMNGTSGIELARELPPACCLVFTTAYAHYALDGFEVDAVDFLHKPHFYERFERAMQKAEEWLQMHDLLRIAESASRSLVLKADYKNVSVAVDTILYIESLDNYVRVHTIDGATVTFKMPANKVTLNAKYIANAPETYKLDVTDAKVTLKDGGAVADLTAVPAGTQLVATADDDTETSVFKSWSCTGLELTEEQSTARVLEFTMPDHDVDLMAAFDTLTKPDPDPTPAPGGDSDGGGAIVMVAAVGGAAIGVGAYIAGTTAYLKSVLPEGMAIPANRQQLAVALWTAAGKPATQSTALFNDVAADAAELQAIRWVVETGLMTAQDGNFKPGSRVGRMEVIRTWKAYQQRG